MIDKTIKCTQSNIFVPFLLYCIKNVYPELDFSNFLKNLGLINKRDYYLFLHSHSYFNREYGKLKINFPNEWKDFKKILDYHKNNYENIFDNLKLGRVGELLNKIIFGKKKKRSLVIFKKLKSKIFDSGIDFLLINYNKMLKNYGFFFFEVKTTKNNTNSCVTKINKWYELENFTKKCVFEFESIKAKIYNSNSLPNSDKNVIIQDLNDFILDLINSRRIKLNFFFCSSIFCEDIQNKSPNFKRDDLLKNGYNYCFIITSFYKNIGEAYKCLDITI